MILDSDEAVSTRGREGGVFVELGKYGNANGLTGCEVGGSCLACGGNL